MIDVNTFKEKIDKNQLYQVLCYLDAEPKWEANGSCSCRTICHHGNSHKLVWYPNTNLFKCYTDCGDTFDLFELVSRNREITLPQSMNFVASFLGIDIFSDQENQEQSNLQDWKIFNKKLEKTDKISTKYQELPLYSSQILDSLNLISVQEWEREGISTNTMVTHNLRFDPVEQTVIIPHYDINNRLIGIRSRTLIKENEKYGKYRPAVLNGKMYNHPLAFNLYNIERARTPIQILKKAIVFEGEKSTLQYESFFGQESNIAVAVCGSNLIQYQASLLFSLGVNEIIIALDKQYKKPGDDEWKKLITNFKNISHKYGGFAKITFLYDTRGLLDYKDSPTDKGKDVFLSLFKERVEFK